MYLLDTCAQPVILGVQFTKKMGMLDSKLRKSMWQIRNASGSIEEVLGESSDLIALNWIELQRRNEHVMYVDGGLLVTTVNI
jgi:hypothetical protein